MKTRKNHIIVCLIFITFLVSNIYATPPLKFKNKKFKIMQFTDLHYTNTEKYKSMNDSTIFLMKRLIEEERPDLVILTGDIVVSEPSTEAWKKVVQPMSDLHVPFAVTFGNHDNETKYSTHEILNNLIKNPLNVTTNEDKSLSGSGNCSLVIKSSDNEKNCWIIYLFDSHAYSEIEQVKGYDWIKNDQIQWYRNRSESLKKNNGALLPALAFFHIPLPEFECVRKQEKTLGNNSEIAHSPSLNSGLFASFIEKNDVKGVFVGHDHNNDFVGQLYGIMLGYGRKTGYVPAHQEILERGGRIIELFEDSPRFNTYIRTLSGKFFELSSYY